MEFEPLIKSIITQQELIIGPVALERANKVPGLSVSQQGKNLQISITGDGKEIIGSLVNEYAQLFGKVSIEVCKEAVMSVGASQENLPDVLK